MDTQKLISNLRTGGMCVDEESSPTTFIKVGGGEERDISNINYEFVRKVMQIKRELSSPNAQYTAIFHKYYPIPPKSPYDLLLQHLQHTQAVSLVVDACNAIDSELQNKAITTPLPTKLAPDCFCGNLFADNYNAYTKSLVDYAKQLNITITPPQIEAKTFEDLAGEDLYASIKPISDAKYAIIALINIDKKMALLAQKIEATYINLYHALEDIRRQIHSSDSSSSQNST